MVTAALLRPRLTLGTVKVQRHCRSSRTRSGTAHLRSLTLPPQRLRRPPHILSHPSPPIPTLAGSCWESRGRRCGRWWASLRCVERSSSLCKRRTRTDAGSRWRARRFCCYARSWPESWPSILPNLSTPALQPCLVSPAFTACKVVFRRSGVPACQPLAAAAMHTQQALGSGLPAAEPFDAEQRRHGWQAPSRNACTPPTFQSIFRTQISLSRA